ncbi:MAG: chain-length determining protein [Bacteroidaceae bacterium]|nr:chain-length determining protein [Bacteroidaceae bacterium]
MDKENKANVKIADFVELIRDLWAHRKRIILNCFWGGVLSIIVAFSIPKEFTSEVVIAPEISSASGITGGLGALASMAGINMETEEEAIYPQLYPQIVATTPFLCDLAALKVDCKYRKDTVSTNIYNYLSQYQKEPWWSKVLTAPFKLIKREKKEILEDGVQLNPKQLSRQQQKVLKELKERITVELDKLTSAIYVNVTMQDARIASIVADALTENLQVYVTDYRTAKARKDMENTQRMCDEARENYYAAQHAYAEYCDQHMGVTKLQYLMEQDRLSNEKDLAFNLYNQLAQQLDMCRTKLLEKTPVVVVLQPSTIPYKATTPKKMMIGILFVFLAFFGTAAWIIVKDRILDA